MISMRKLWKSGFGLDRFSGIALFALFIIVFGIVEPSTFLTMATVHSIAAEESVVAIVALAVTLSLSTGSYDLSVGAVAGLSGITAVVLQTNWHWSMAAALIASVGIALLVGLVNSFVVVGLRIDSFIATLGMGSILAAFETIVTGSQQPVPVASATWGKLTQVNVFGFQAIIVYALVLALVGWWFLECTPAGRQMYATGGNRDSARLSGVRVDLWTTVSLVCCAGLAGIAGILFTSQNGPSVTFGPTLLLPAFAAAFLGSTQLRPGRFNVWGTVLSIFVLATGVEGLQLLSGQEWLSDMFNGVALIAAVGLAVSRSDAGKGRRWLSRWRPAPPAATDAATKGQQDQPVVKSL